MTPRFCASAFQLALQAKAKGNDTGVKPLIRKAHVNSTLVYLPNLLYDAMDDKWDVYKKMSL